MSANGQEVFDKAQQKANSCLAGLMHAPLRELLDRP